MDKYRIVYIKIIVTSYHLHRSAFKDNNYRLLIVRPTENAGVFHTHKQWRLITLGKLPDTNNERVVECE